MKSPQGKTRKLGLRAIAALFLVFFLAVFCQASRAESGTPAKLSDRFNILQVWFQQLSQNRPGANAKPEEIEAYNQQCAAYKAAVASYESDVQRTKNSSQPETTPAPPSDEAKTWAEQETVKARQAAQHIQPPSVTFVEPPYGRVGVLGVNVLKVKGKILKAEESAELTALQPDSGGVFALAPGWINEPLLGSSGSPSVVIMMKAPLVILGSSSYTEGDTFEDVVYPVCAVPLINRLGLSTKVYYYATSPRLATQLKAKDPSIKGKGSGSGFFITSQGHLVTNWHVVSKAKHIEVRTNGKAYVGQLLAFDKTNDLAILKIEAATSPLPIAPSRDVSLGQDVFTVGFPDCTLQGVKPKLTTGSISSLFGIRDDPRCFQMSVPVQPGNSGGSLVDANGNVVGVVSATLNTALAVEATGQIPQTVNYAIKSSFLSNLLESIPEVARKLPAAQTTPPESKNAVYKAAEAAAAMIIIN